MFTYKTAAASAALIATLWPALPGVALADAALWQSRAPMPTSRYSAAAGVIGGSFIVTGGCCALFSYPYTRFGSTEFYNAAGDSWSIMQTMPLPVVDAASGVIGGKLYVAGGAADNEHGNNVAALQIYNPLTNVWSTGASLPSASSNATGGVINGKLYVAGGQDAGNFTATADLRMYDPLTDSWTALPSMPTPRSAAVSAVIDNKLYVVGGLNNTATRWLNVVEVYDPAGGWTSRTAAPTARYRATGGLVNGKLYVVAGVGTSETSLATVEVYDPVSDSWSAAPPLPTPAISPTAGVVNNVLYVAGGLDFISGAPTLSNLLYAMLPQTVQVQQPINADGSSVFGAKRGVIPVKFTYALGGAASCSLPPATIALTRTAGGTTGEIDEGAYAMTADSGANFRIASCQYVYNLATQAIGVGSYRVDVYLGGMLAGSAAFGVK